MGDKIIKVTYYGVVSESSDDNIDISVELNDGQSFNFTVYTAQNIVSLMDTQYSESLEWVCEGMIIVRRIDETCILAALQKCIEIGIEKFGIRQTE